MNVLVRDRKLTLTVVTPTVVALVKVVICMVLMVPVWVVLVGASDVICEDVDFSALVDVTRVVVGEAVLVSEVVV